MVQDRAHEAESEQQVVRCDSAPHEESNPEKPQNDIVPDQLASDLTPGTSNAREVGSPSVGFASAASDISVIESGACQSFEDGAAQDDNEPESPTERRGKGKGKGKRNKFNGEADTSSSQAPTEGQGGNGRRNKKSKNKRQ